MARQSTLSPFFFKFKSSVLFSLVVFSVPQKALSGEVPVNGTLIYNLDSEPPTLHPILSTDRYATNVQTFVCDALLTRNLSTWEWKPALAEKWEISKDNKQFTFKLRKNIFFHDGKPITAEDVKFSFETVNDPAYEGQAAHLQNYFEGIQKVEVVDEQTVKFYTKDTYFKNFETAATHFILPKHIYSDVKKAQKLSKSLTCSGPYLVDKFERGQKILLKRFDKWYGFSDDAYKGFYNFKAIDMRFYKDEIVQIERIKKGDIDFLEFFRPEAFIKKLVGPEIGKKVFKFQVENKTPKSYDFIGWNLEKDLFKNRDVRLALAHLMNREEMNKKFRNGLSELAIGPIHVRSEFAPTNVKPILFDPKKAQELLAKSGWIDSDKDGVLDKIFDGKKVDFKFTLLYPNKEKEKYWTMYKEDLKKSGIEMEMRYLEWNSYMKTVDEGNFEAFTMGWSGGGIEPDPKQIWHSAHAVRGGSNMIHYKNPEVDKLIDEARISPDRATRIKLLKQVYEKIAADAPYVFMFNEKYQFYATSARIQKPAETFNFDIGLANWWINL